MDEMAYEIVGVVAVFRLRDSRELEDGVRRVKDVILQVKLAGIAKLLVDITGIAYGPPGVADRYWLMTEWASAGRGALRVALVTRPEFIEPERFATAVARNHGLDFRAFTIEEHAMAWLGGSVAMDQSG